MAAPLSLFAADLPGAAGPGGPWNHLRGEKSPYLLQHARNPVDWYPWGEEAFRKARDEDRPIFLSIGYSTCHWCHVMAHESFEDPEVGRLMNATFVPVKVDREERPDLDEQYMTAAALLAGAGGWPLNVVLTPAGRPFFAATYIPKGNAMGRTGLLELVPRLGELWRTRRADLLAAAGRVVAELGRPAAAGPGARSDAQATRDAPGHLAGAFDRDHGGFGRAPKFPMPSVYPLLLRAWKRSGDPAVLAMTEKSLTAMRNGGIYDQIGFGFHRYATDAAWLVPHFEKMLYDQALLTLAYTETWQATEGELYRRTAREIAAYVLRDLTSPEGAFYSAEDADSEGEEGKFYLWTTAEAQSVLGRVAFARFRDRYRLREEGNFAAAETPGAPGQAGPNILHRDPADRSAPGPEEAALLTARAKRIRPFRDDKILADWNGLMIAALARAGGAFEDAAPLRAAAEAARFVLERMRAADGRLLHRWRDGEAAIPAFADDYAFLAWGLIELYEATFDSSWLQQAAALLDTLIARFWDPQQGGFFSTADEAEPGPAGRRKSLEDGVLPSANSVALLVLLRLGGILENRDYREKAEALIGAWPRSAVQTPLFHAFFLSALDYAAGPSFEVVVAGDAAREDTREMVRALRRRFIPNRALVFRPAAVDEPEIVRLAPFTRHQAGVNGKATAYVCRDYACRLPTNEVAVMLEQLGAS